MKGFLLAALLLLQDGELDRLLQQLGDADPAVRSRASSLLFRLDPAALVAKLEKLQRNAKLNHNATKDWKAPEPSAATEGGVFHFYRRPWKVDGLPVGTIFATSSYPLLEGELEWSVAGIRDDRNLTVETCNLHSPASVYIAALPPLPCTVTVKGTRRWYCDVPVEFKGPVEGTTQRVGKFALTVRWPEIEVTADSPVPQHIVARMLKGWEIRCELKPGVQRRGGRKENLVPRAGRVRESPQNPAWCGCPGKPTRGERPPLPTTTTWKVPVINNPFESADEIESISLTFHNPVEETFEVTSPPLK